MAALCGLAPLLHGCTTAACSHGEYDAPECRVAAEVHYARLLTSTGVGLTFTEPDAVEVAVLAVGLLEETAEHVLVRPATLMDFAVALDPGDLGATEVTLRLENVATDAAVTVGPLGAEVEVPGPLVGTSRDLVVPLADEVVWVRGTRACPESYRLVMAGDVQTNPLQFERILETLHDSFAEAREAGAPLLGFVLLGDLAEHPVEDELEHVRDLLAKSPVPVSVVPGNHDVHGDEFALYNRIFGSGSYTQEVCTSKLALLDTGAGALAPSVQARLPSMLERGGFDFLVAGAHYPAFPGRTGSGWGDQAAEWYLLSELARNEADLYVAGHYHSWEEMPAVPVGDGEVHQIVSGTLGATQGNGLARYGTTRLTFSGAGVASCFDEVLPPGRLESETGGQGGIRFCD